MDFTRRETTFLKVILVWLLCSTSVVTLLMWPDPVHRALIKMGLGLVILWILVCGGLMLRFRRPIAKFVLSIPLDWRLKFVLFCTLLALLEEAITTGMTNLAPFFGVRIGQAYITASANYLDVVALHSVSLFVSFFVGWAVILSKVRFSPFSVLLLFGITGTIAEVLFAGPAHFLEFGMWLFVYGWMVYLPACSVPDDRPAREPRYWHYPVAVFAPFLFMVLFPLMGVISIFYPHHPKFHFPPII